MRDKLFHAERLTTAELYSTFHELRIIFRKDFAVMELARFLPDKQDHGDVDTLVLWPHGNLAALLHARLGERMLRFERNGHTHTFLYQGDIGRPVQVDFIVSPDALTYQTSRDYYVGGDVSAAVGVLAKRLHFRYGSEGFFKRYQDCRTTWHSIFITHDLREGLKILGFPCPNDLDRLQNWDDIVDFIASSVMFDSCFYETKALTTKDRQAVRKRQEMDYICDKLRTMGRQRLCEDEDHFFKKCSQYGLVEDAKKEIDEDTYQRSSVYNGDWLIQKFGMRPGPEMGGLLRDMSNCFDLATVAEEDVTAYVIQWCRTKKGV